MYIERDVLGKLLADIMDDLPLGASFILGAISQASEQIMDVGGEWQEVAQEIHDRIKKFWIENGLDDEDIEH